jgi:branched-chain amino acid transport system ATP-binding protein
MFNGRSLAGMVTEDVVRCGISLVPEGRRIFARMTIAENLRLGMTVRTDRAEAAADLEQTLERFPILRSRYRSQAGLLSGGEQQQLAIARALLTRPKLLLLDEPSLGLSPKMTDTVYATLASLRSAGLTLLIVEQSVDRISDIADRFYIVSGGVTRLSGAREQLKDNTALEHAYFGHVEAQ